MPDDDLVVPVDDIIRDIDVDGYLVRFWWEPDLARQTWTLRAYFGDLRLAVKTVGESTLRARNGPREASRVSRAWLRQQFGWPTPITPRMVYGYGPAWGSVTVDTDTEAALLTVSSPLRYDKARRTITRQPEPEPTLRPTGGRKFDLDDEA